SQHLVFPPRPVSAALRVPSQTRIAPVHPCTPRSVTNLFKRGGGPCQLLARCAGPPSRPDAQPRPSSPLCHLPRQLLLRCSTSCIHAVVVPSSTGPLDCFGSYHVPRGEYQPLALGTKSNRRPDGGKGFRADGSHTSLCSAI